jgi:very-short-patch-repair endonuclease
VVAKKRTERARDLRLTDSLAEQKVWELLRAHRTDVLEQAGWRVIRFTASEALQNIDGVWAEIAQALGIET